MSMTEYATARPAGADVQARIKAAVTAYYQARREMPAAVIVHPSEVDTARAAMPGLELSVAVRPNGGCLAGEIWLEVPEAIRA